MSKTYLFISDIHLGLQSKEEEKVKERLLVKFFTFAKDNCDELFIVGDLFDYWFEYKRVYQKGFFRTLTALQDITEAGIKLHYFIGNHDFLHRDFFRKEIGAIMHPEPSEFILNGKKFFIGHGDGLVQNDNGYKILKSILRNRFLQKAYSIIHPDLGVALASGTSKSSREYTSSKDYGEGDGLLESAKQKIDDGYDYVLFGHLHKRLFINFRNGAYINLGSWLDNPCYGKYTDSKFEIVEWY
ncbi:MAG TPA: UDP-2,3-diacylglucosamine diphosphatase [Ignavibacteriaceae bacterium]|nr:UDP-2,3-diacylglucosamine diphosphatase [Ignavibacteriaceae bacterium]